VPRLSIVIPCLGGAAEFDGTLVSVLQNRPADCEVLVVHTDTYDDPYKLRGEVRFIQTQGNSLVELLNTAIHEAAGEVLHIVGCGLEVSEGWTAPALTHFDDPEVAAVSPVILGVDQKSVIAAGLRWSLGGARHVVRDRRIVAPGSGRLRARIHGPTLAAAFYRRDLLVAIGGFETGIGTVLADVSVALAIQSLEQLHVCEPASQLVQVRELPSIAAVGFIDGRAAERLFWRSAAERGLALAMGLHLLTIVGDTLRLMPSPALVTTLAGRAAAWFEFAAVQRHERNLAVANERLKELAELRASVRKTPKRSRPCADEANSPRRRAA
jgi:hypothetical protein